MADKVVINKGSEDKKGGADKAPSTPEAEKKVEKKKVASGKTLVYCMIPLEIQIQKQVTESEARSYGILAQHGKSVKFSNCSPRGEFYAEVTDEELEVIKKTTSFKHGKVYLKSIGNKEV